MRGVKMMYDYRGKVAGMAVAAIGICLLVLERVTGWLLFHRLSEGQQTNVFLLIAISGLFLMMFSYEKLEDERVKAIRAKSLITTTAMVLGTTLSLAATATIIPIMDPEQLETVMLTKEDIIFAPRLLMALPALGTVLYLIIFHLGLRFDQTWDSDEKAWSVGSIWKDKRYKLLYIVVGLIAVWIVSKMMD